MLKKKTSEKLSEILFNAYFLRLFELGEIEFFAPSQVAELELGYDASFRRKEEEWEVILQFKQPSPRKGGEAFTITIEPNQLSKLHKLNQRHVFYAAPAHCTYKEIVRLQQHTIKDPCDFLNTYILIDVSQLPMTTATIRYDRNKYGHFYMPSKPRYRCAHDESSESVHKKIDFFTVCEFAEGFQNHQIGQRILLKSDTTPARYDPNINVPRMPQDTLEYTSGDRQISLIDMLSPLLSRNELTLIMRLRSKG